MLGEAPQPGGAFGMSVRLRAGTDPSRSLDGTWRRRKIGGRHLAPLYPRRGRLGLPRPSFARSPRSPASPPWSSWDAEGAGVDLPLAYARSDDPTASAASSSRSSVDIPEVYYRANRTRKGSGPRVRVPLRRGPGDFSSARTSSRLSAEAVPVVPASRSPTRRASGSPSPGSCEGAVDLLPLRLRRGTWGIRSSRQHRAEESGGA